MDYVSKNWVGSDSYKNYLVDNFKAARDASMPGIFDCRCRYSVYSLQFLNTVAAMQGSDARVARGFVPESNRNGIQAPGLRVLLGQAKSVRDVRIDTIIGGINAELAAEYNGRES